MADGTKSTDHEVPDKKRKSKGEAKSGNKRASTASGGATTKGGKKEPAKKDAKGGKQATQKSSQDDLDIEGSHQSEELEASD